jgi:hypothetical protein
MNPALAILAAITILGINIVQAEKDQQELNPSEHRYRYNCTTEGIQLMISDGFEAKTIKTICKELRS